MAPSRSEECQLKSLKEWCRPEVKPTCLQGHRRIVWTIPWVLLDKGIREMSPRSRRLLQLWTLQILETNSNRRCVMPRSRLLPEDLQRDRWLLVALEANLSNHRLRSRQLKQISSTQFTRTKTLSQPPWKWERKRAQSCRWSNQKTRPTHSSLP